MVSVRRGVVVVSPGPRNLAGVPVAPFRFIDLFAGIGGFHAALSAYGGRCVYAVEIDKRAAEVYELNWGRIRSATSPVTRTMTS